MADAPRLEDLVGDEVAALVGAALEAPTQSQRDDLWTVLEVLGVTGWQPGSNAFSLLAELIGLIRDDAIAHPVREGVLDMSVRMAMRRLSDLDNVRLGERLMAVWERRCSPATFAVIQNAWAGAKHR